MIHVPSKAFLHRRPPAVPAGVPPVVPLELVSATYDPDFSSVTLTFNQDIDTDAAVLETISVNDAQFQGLMLRAFTTTGLTANSVTVEMEYVAPASGSGVKLTADAGNGVFPASGGDEWVGVNELALPFGG